jgi:hypothetical protein
MVARRHQAGPFVLKHEFAAPDTADHPARERHCGQGLVRLADEPPAAPPATRSQLCEQTQPSQLAQRVTAPIRPPAGSHANEPSESNRPEWLGCPAHP